AHHSPQDATQAPATLDGPPCRWPSAEATAAARSTAEPCTPVDAPQDTFAARQRSARDPAPQPRRPPAALPPSPGAKPTASPTPPPPPPAPKPPAPPTPPAHQPPTCAARPASISPGSTRNPRTFTWLSSRPRNSTRPSTRQRTTSPVRYRRSPPSAL